MATLLNRATRRAEHLALLEDRARKRGEWSDDPATLAILLSPEFQRDYQRRMRRRWRPEWTWLRPLAEYRLMEYRARLPAPAKKR